MPKGALVFVTDVGIGACLSANDRLAAVLPQLRPGDFPLMKAYT